MTLFRLFLRDCAYYRKPFAALSATACLVCAILTGALLIGDSVRGTLHDNLNQNTAFVKTLWRFPAPIDVPLAGGVLSADGFIAPGVKTHLYAFPDDAHIKGRDAYCSSALAEALNLRVGDSFTVRVQTVSPVSSESLVGRPPKLKQVQFIYRGVWPDQRADANFENPQLRANNLFVSHVFLAQTLELPNHAVNEAWLREPAELSDEAVWALSQLEIDYWEDRPVLKSKAYFLPERIRALFPHAAAGVTTFAESLTDGQHELNYFFVGAFEKDIFPVAQDQVVLSDAVDKDFPSGAELSYFTTDAYREIIHKTHRFTNVTKASAAILGTALNPEIPGLTDADACSHWDAGLPIDFSRINDEDNTYWERYRSKPKLFLNFAQAQALFFAGQCNLLIFEPGTDAAHLQETIITALRHDPGLFQAIDIAEIFRNEIDRGVQFAPLFLGLSLFIIISALLVLGMLLKLHLLDRADALQTLDDFSGCGRKLSWFLSMEITAILLPGVGAGLLLGMLLCRVQLYLLERVWNEIIRMNRLAFHVESRSLCIAFGVTLLCALPVVLWSLRNVHRKHRYAFSASQPVRSIQALGALSFARQWGQYRICMAMLVLGFLGTLGVGAFGIKVRGEDGFSYHYVAETALPVVPAHDVPFPAGGLAVRVKHADSADCSNILQSDIPTVYGCDLQALTGDPHFLSPLSAAADTGSMLWIMKKKVGDVIPYQRGSITLDKTLKASVFQRGILVDSKTFENLFPEVQGAQFFLIRDHESAEAYHAYLAPYGVTLSTVDAFMARAESFQNRYLAIFLQLGVLGFLLGIGSLLLLMLRNLHARREEIIFLGELGFSSRQLLHLYLTENLCLYLTGAITSLLLLGLLACVAQLHLPTLLWGWAFLTLVGIFLIIITVSLFLRSAD